MNELQRKLESLGFNEVHRWVGETFDHETNPNSQLEGIKKLYLIAESCISLAETHLEKKLKKLLKETTKIYVNTVHRMINNPTLQPSFIRETVIGDGNLRVIAKKN